MKTHWIAVALAGAALSLSGGCQPAAPDDAHAAAQARQLFASPTVPELSELAAPVAPAARDPNLQGVRMPPPGAGGAKRSATPAWDERFRGFETVAEEFPWGAAEDGAWTGTGSPDPEPLRKITDEEMLGRASLTGAPDDRLNALVSCGRRKMPGALAVLQAALDPKEPMMVRMLAISGLIEHGGTEALGLMWQAFDDPSPNIRGPAIWAIALYGPQEALRGVEAGWADEHPAVKGMAILALTAVHSESRARQLLKRAIESEEQLVWQEAAYVLGNIPTPWARRLLAAGYDSAKGLKRSSLRFSLKTALAKNFGRMD